MAAFSRELRHAVRRLRRAPAFSATAVFVLALGLGAAAAMFSIVDSVLLRPLPFPNSDRLVAVTHTASIEGVSSLNQSDGTFMLYARHNRVFEHIAAVRATNLSIAPLDGASGEPERVLSAGVSADFMQTLGISAARGRAFTADDDRVGAPPVIVLSDALWRRKYGADPAIIGQQLLINNVRRQVVGIMPGQFGYPSPATQLWYPLQLDPAHSSPASFNFDVIARLKPGVTDEVAAADLARILPSLLDEFQSEIPKAMFEQVHLKPVVAPLKDEIVGRVSRLLWMLLAAVGLLLAVACANVANLFLVRSEGRQRELAVRNALGATRRALFTPQLAEALLLSVSGGVIGLVIAATAIHTLAALPSGVSLPRLAEVSVNGTVAGFVIALTIVCAVAVSVVPLLRTRRIPIAAVLRDAGRSAPGGPEKQRARAGFVVAQVAMTLVLVASSGLVARSFMQLRNVQPGFEPANLNAVRVSLPRTKYRSSAQRAAFFRDLISAARALPGVRDAAASTWMPLTGDNDNSALDVEDLHLAPNAVPPVHDMSYVSSDWFAAMRIPLISGRTLGRQDPAAPLHEAVVSRAFADRYWKNGSALGRRVRPALAGPWFTIVGVVGDVHLASLQEPAEQAVYFPLVMPEGDSTDAAGSAMLVVSTASESPAIAASIRQIVHRLDPSLPTYDEAPASAIVASSAGTARFLATLLGAASVVALLLGAVGIYGVIAYGVSQRHREIGVRMALGARPADVGRLISRQGAGLALIGVAIGLPIAIATTRLMRGLLYGVSPTDPLTLGGTCAVLLAVALLSSWLPARRASAVDPAVALRSD
jgi:predicted permease